MPFIFNVDGYNNVSFQFEGRYAHLGNLDERTKTILFAFHGQGQLAKYFIQKFKGLQSPETVIIAPEGLHQYYLQGFSGRVGASWMTSENRLIAIKNYIRYLDMVYSDVVDKVGAETKINLLGFSQGAATVSRWVNESSFNFERLILWGGTLPPDLDTDNIKNRMGSKGILQVIARKDPYFTIEKEKEMKHLYEKYGLALQLKYYNGEHNIDSALLLELLSHD